MSRIREYFQNSSLHGFHFILEPGKHWTERLFWIIVCGCSGYYTWSYLMATIHTFKNNAVTFVMETDYLHWNTTFPSVSICEQESPDKLMEIAREFFGEERDMNIDFYFRDIAFFDGACYSCLTHCSTGELKCPEDFDSIISRVREKCEDLISNCTWNGEPFDCCENFLPLPTETGICYTINSIHTQKKKNSLPKLVSNRRTGPGILEVQAFGSVKVYIHSYEDVPYANHPPTEKFTLNWGSTYIVKIHVTEIDNDRHLSLVDLEQRNCRLPKETDLEVYEYYGYSTCNVNCRARMQMQLCNCTSHYIPFRNKDGKITCDIKGLSCLTTNAEALRALRVDDLQHLGISECKCMSSCNEPEFYVVWSDTQLKSQNDSSEYGTKISIDLDRLPTERYSRTVVRTRLDLVVSIGGTLGLFLGASILSFVELWYYVFIRMRSFNVGKLTSRRANSKVENEENGHFQDKSKVAFTTLPKFKNSILPSDAFIRRKTILHSNVHTIIHNKYQHL